MNSSMAADCDLQVQYWGLDSRFWVHRKLFVKAIHELKESKEFKGVYQTRNDVIIRVEVLGTIISVDDREKLVIYGDDGTGIIPCCHWKENSSRIDVCSLGQLVTVQGKLSTFRDQRQLTVSSIVVEDNLNAEILFWLDVVRLNKEVYSRPFVLSDAPSGGEVSTHTQDLMQFLRGYTRESRSIRFSFTHLCSKSEVQGIAHGILSSKYNEQGAKDTRHLLEVNKVVRQMLRQLEVQGEIYYKDAAVDSYEIITHEHHLKPAILKAIKEISKGSPHQGAHIARITDVLHSSQTLRRVGSTRIQDSLKKLICDSEIYQQSKQVYCIV